MRSRPDPRAAVVALVRYRFRVISAARLMLLHPVNDALSMRGSAVMFATRAAAGRALAEAIRQDPDRQLQILAVSRDAVAVAAQIAAAFGLDVELVCARASSIAIAIEGCRPYVELDRVIELGLHATEVTAHLAELTAELEVAVALFHGHRPLPPLYDRHAVLVDDGATPARLLVAAVQWARAQGAGRVTVAIPACSIATLDMLASAADDVACCEEADPRGIELVYDDAEPLGDFEAMTLLERIRLAAVRVRALQALRTS